MAEQQDMRKNGSNKMGEMPVHRLFITMAIPLIISMLVQTLYNIVDSAFVARINEDALTAVTLVGPVMNLMFAVAGGTGVGFNALISRYLGQGNRQKANEVANNGIFLNFCSYLVFLVIGILFTRKFIMMQTDIASIVDYGTTYMSIIMVLSFGMFGQVTIERLLQSTGKTIFPMITQMTGAVINIFFDAMLIFGIGPFPEMGVAGAALATIFGQCTAMVLGVIFNARYNDEVKINFRLMKPNAEHIKNIYKIGVPSIIMISISSVMTFGMNKILMGFSSTAVALFGVFYKLQNIVFMPSFGMNNAAVPIVGYNFGAGKHDRIHKTYRIACTYAEGIMLIGFVLFQVIPGKLLLLFNASENMLGMGIPAMRIMSIVFLCAGISVMSSGVFQALGKSTYSMIVSLIRQLIVLLPAAFIFAQTGVLNYVWISLPLSEGIGFVVTLILMRKINRYLKMVEAGQTSV